MAEITSFNLLLSQELLGPGLVRKSRKSRKTRVEWTSGEHMPSFQGATQFGLSFDVCLQDVRIFLSSSLFLGSGIKETESSVRTGLRVALSSKPTRHNPGTKCVYCCTTTKKVGRSLFTMMWITLTNLFFNWGLVATSGLENRMVNFPSASFHSLGRVVIMEGEPKVLERPHGFI